MPTALVLVLACFYEIASPEELGVVKSIFIADDVIFEVGDRHPRSKDTTVFRFDDGSKPVVFTTFVSHSMGACSSCCTSNGSPERELLLPKSGPRNREEAIAQYTDKVADIAGALEAGRLPSQVQINRAFKSLLNSNLLNVETTNARVPPLLRKELVTIVNDIKEVVVAMLEFGEEKNGS